tara:strand:+ start:2567 stop:3106 length:540 start_codon:yes stop_codon:yes gene_type:complete
MSLRSDYESHLKKHGVKFNFREGSNKYKTLLALYENIGNWMSKAEIVERIEYTGSDLQDARHLGKQSGWYVDQDGKGNYKLVTTKQPHPSFAAKKRLNELNTSDFKVMKEAYDNRCATCGEKEGTRHRFEHGKVVLEKGHMDPRKDMSPENIIPQCNFCNKFYGDKFVFDRQGRIVESL